MWNVECESKSDTGNNRGDWNHFKIAQTIPEHRGEFRPRQTRQLPRAVDLKGRLSKLSKLLITTTPFHSLTERYSMNVDGNFN